MMLRAATLALSLLALSACDKTPRSSAAATQPAAQQFGAGGGGHDMDD